MLALTKDLIEVQNSVARLTRRRRVTRGVAWAQVGALAGAAAGLIILALSRLFPLMDRTESMVLLAVAVLAGTLVGACAGLYWPVNRERLLTAAELRLRLYSRLSTALATDHRVAHNDLVAAQAADAAAAARSVNWRPFLPITVRRRYAAGTVLILALSLGTLLLPNPQDERLAERRAVAGEQRVQAERLRKAAADVRRSGAGQPAEAAAAEMERLATELAPGSLTREEATARIAAGEAAIQRASNDGPGRSRAALQRAAAALDAAEATRPLARAVARGDIDATRREAGQLAGASGAMRAADRTAAASALRNAAAAASLDPKLSSALQTASSLEGRALRALGQQLAASQQAAATADALDAAASQLQTSRQSVAAAGAQARVAQAGTGGASGPASSAQPGPGNSGAGQGAGSGNSARPSGQGQARSAGTGAGRQGGLPGQGSGSTTNPTGGGGGGATGTSRGGRPNGGNPNGKQSGREAVEPYSPTYAPSRVGPDGKITAVRAPSGPGQPASSEQSSGNGMVNVPTRPYGEAYAEYAPAAGAYLDTHYIPGSLKTYVRDYFDTIAPQEESATP